MRFDNRVTRLLGVDYPIIQALMGWIARAQLASAVSNAGGMGMIETSSDGFDAIRSEIKRVQDLTRKPFGKNIAQAFVKHPDIVSFLADEGVKFVTTLAGDPRVYCEALKKAGFTVFHVVPTLKAAQRAVECGVDGLVVEGGGFKNAGNLVSTMVLTPLVCERVEAPVIAAGGVVDGRTMAAAFALGAEGDQPGARMVSSAEAPVHDQGKQAIVAAQETDTVVVNPVRGGMAMRTLRTAKTTGYETEPPESVACDFRRILSLYRDGDLEASVAMTGQVAGRIHAVQPVAEILREIVTGFDHAVRGLNAAYPAEPKAVGG